jgi:uncharacterized phage-associated protein
MGKFEFKKEDYILYLLNRIEPEKSDFWRLNKIAFLVEFAYLYFKEKELSNAEYAAIIHGPVINDYRDILGSMELQKLIRCDNYNIRVLTDKKIEVPEEIANFIDQRIAKYATMTNGELKAITHATDSYKITTKNEKIWGMVIDKSLASLETFFEEKDDDVEAQIKEEDLPRFQESDLKRYEF